MIPLEEILDVAKDVGITLGVMEASAYVAKACIFPYMKWVEKRLNLYLTQDPDFKRMMRQPITYYTISQLIENSKKVKNNYVNSTE